MAIRKALPFEFPFRWNAMRQFLDVPDEAIDYFDQRDRDLEDFLALLHSYAPHPDEWTQIWSGDVYDLTFDGTYWWTVDGVDTVTKRSTAGVAVSSFTVGTGVLRGITFDGTDLWVSGEVTPNEVILQYSQAGSLLGTITTGPDTDGNHGIAWDGSQNWLAAQKLASGLFDAERWTVSGTETSSFTMGGNNIKGLAFYGGRLYAVDQTTATIRVYQTNGVIAETITGIPSGVTGLWIGGDGAIYVSTGSAVYQRGDTTDAGVALVDLTDVDVTSPSDGDVLTYQAATETWVPSAVSGGGGSGTFSGVALRKSVTQSIPHETFTIITWDAEDYDTDGFHDTSTNTSRITIPVGGDGYYQFGAFIEYPSNPSDGIMILLKNGVDTGVWSRISPGGIAVQHLVSGPLSLAAGDYLELRLRQSSGGSMSLGANGRDRFWGHKVG